MIWNRHYDSGNFSSVFQRVFAELQILEEAVANASTGRNVTLDLQAWLRNVTYDNLNVGVNPLFQYTDIVDYPPVMTEVCQ